MKRYQKELLKIALAFLAYILALLLPAGGRAEFLLFLISYLIVGSGVLWDAVKNIARRQLFDENFLMAIATIGAFCIKEYPEGAAVMLFYQVGELFQSYAVGKSRKSIAELMEIRPDYANVLRDGEWKMVAPEEVAKGEAVIVKPGEKIPLDGVVVKGGASIDTKALTGESMPRDVGEGDEVISGCININGIVTIKVLKAFEESTVSKILELVENAAGKKAETEKFITKFARYYTPAVVLTAALLAVLPPLLLPGAVFADWFYRALIFLVVSCPCALVLSIPLGFFGGIGGASRQGILVKGSNYLELLHKAEIVVFDKTGTLTKGNFKVTEIRPSGISREMLLEYAAKAEYYSNHPIALSIKQAYGKQLAEGCASDIVETAGQGVQASVEGQMVCVGNAKLMQTEGIAFEAYRHPGTVVYIAAGGAYAGCILIEDEMKEDAALAVKALKEAGVLKTVLLTGDAEEIGEKAAKALAIDEVHAELLPADKVRHVEDLLLQKSPGGKLVYVGDGINDAPVLARADIGIAMGGLGQDAAIEAADIVIMTDEPSKIAQAMRISNQTMRIVKQNIVFALSIKALVLLLGAAGLSNMWEAVFADVGVAVIAILNAMRSLKSRNLFQ